MISDDINTALRYIKSGDYPKAHSTLKRVINHDPLNERAWLLLAICVETNDEKIDCLEKALEIDPRSYLIRNFIGQIESIGRITRRVESLIIGIVEGEAIILERGSNNNPTTETDSAKPTTKFHRKSEAKYFPKPNWMNYRTRLSHRARYKIERFVPIKVEYRSPQVITINQGHDFFFGFKQGMNQSSRNNTGVFGKTIIIDGVYVFPYSGPECIRVGRNRYDHDCEECEFFSPIDCILRYDEFLADDLNRLTAIQQIRNAIKIKKRLRVANIIHKELRAHGRPLHYTYIADIIRTHYPKLKISTHGVYVTIRWHPELFERVDKGVYRAI